jgi:hypothetical protein
MMYMRHYVALRVREEVDGLTVALSEDVPWGLLAEFSDQSPLAIIGCDLPEDDPLPGNLHPVSPELDVLLWSCQGYPPALARARYQVRWRHRELLRAGLPLDSDTFQRELATLLRHHLDSQPTAPYLLARCVRESLGYNVEGGYYWLVGFGRQEDRIWWVSKDYFVYDDDIEDFDVTREQLDRLPDLGP